MAPPWLKQHMYRTAVRCAGWGLTLKQAAPKVGCTYEQLKYLARVRGIAFAPTKRHPKMDKTTVHQIKSEATKKMWLDPDYRAKQAQVGPRNCIPVPPDFAHAYRVLTRKAGYSRHDALIALRVSHD